LHHTINRTFAFAALPSVIGGPAVRVDYLAYPDDPEYLMIDVCLSHANDRLCSWSAQPASKRPSGDTLDHRRSGDGAEDR
jgi:hypothetical protein